MTNKIIIYKIYNFNGHWVVFSLARLKNEIIDISIHALHVECDQVDGDRTYY